MYFTSILESHILERVEFGRVCTRLGRLPDADGERGQEEERLPASRCVYLGGSMSCIP